MKVYQIMVKGVYKYMDGSFRCASATVYKERPTQAIIDEFVAKCAEPRNGNDLFVLNTSEPYKTTIVELDLV